MSEEILKAVKILMNDPGLRLKLGKNAGEFIRENYPVKKMARLYAEQYTEVLIRSGYK